MRLQQRSRTAEEKFRDFLYVGFGVRPSDYERMDKDLQAAINDKFAYVFLRNPLDDRIRQFLLSPGKSSYCHAPGCEWRESELSAFGTLVRRCVRCEHYQVRAAHGTSAWQDISRHDYEFLVLRDETHRAQWDSVPPVLSAASTMALYEARNAPAPLSIGEGNGAPSMPVSTNGADNFDTASMRR